MKDSISQKRRPTQVQAYSYYLVARLLSLWLSKDESQQVGVYA